MSEQDKMNEIFAHWDREDAERAAKQAAQNFTQNGGDDLGSQILGAGLVAAGIIWAALTGGE